MLSHLKLQNLILIEQAEIEFGKGLNIFTGETGSGKSAILNAIRLIAGERADTEWIREGSSTAVVEGKLSFYSKELLGDIDPPPPGEPLTIRREIHRSGKSRSLIEDRLVNAAVLRELMRPMIELVDQSSSMDLSLPEKQRVILDTYGGLETEARTFGDAFTRLAHLKKELESLNMAEANRRRDLEWAESGLRAIEEVNWQKEEEESLSQTHLILTHAQELAVKIESITEGLSHLSPHLRHIAHLLESAATLDPKLTPSASSVKTAALELDEAEHFLRSYASGLESDPGRLSEVESRIGAIEHLKRRFGRSWADVEKQKETFAAEITGLENLDQSRVRLADQIKILEEQTNIWAKQLSEKRRTLAKKLSGDVLNELRSLNLPHAQFDLEITEKPITSHGIDEIQFLFTANPGRAPLPLQQCASGGELSRLLFAIKVAIAEKDNVQCLIFDEIDSNVGGQTAAILGEKLIALSQKRQVICVTHFVQVARCALHHFSVAKQDQNGSAKTIVEPLNIKEREKEYARMIGH